MLGDTFDKSYVFKLTSFHRLQVTKLLWLTGNWLLEVLSSYSQFRCRSCCTCRTEDWPDTPPPARTSWRSSEERLEVPSGPVNGLTSSLYRGFTLTFGSGKNIPHLKDFLDRRLSVNSSDKMVYYLISTLDFLLSEITKFSASSIFLSSAVTWARPINNLHVCVFLLKILFGYF